MLSVQLLLLVAASVAGPQHFDVAAAFEPPTKPGATGAIAVTFAPRDPDVHINEDPAPRLRLDLEQSALLDKQPPPPKTVDDVRPGHGPLRRREEAGPLPGGLRCGRSEGSAERQGDRRVLLLLAARSLVPPGHGRPGSRGHRPLTSFAAAEHVVSIEARSGSWG